MDGLKPAEMVKYWSDASRSGHTTTLAAEEAAETWLREANSKSSSFEDPDFPATADSLGAKHSSVVMVIVKGRTKTKKKVAVSWKRPQTIQDDAGSFGSEYQILAAGQPAGASSVIYRALGACWLQSALAAVAERPHLLENVVRTVEVQPAGAYQIRLCVGGVWCVVPIDDRIPCDAEFSRMAFTRGPGRQLWVPLVEKACAKVAGSYTSIEGGHITEGFRLLTGAPATQFHIAVCATNEELKHARAMHTAAEMLRRASAPGGTVLPPSLRVKKGAPLPPVSAAGPPSDATVGKVWARLLQYHREGYIMGASCGVDVNTVAVSGAELKRIQGEAEAAGLSIRHAYSILTLLEHKGVRLVRLRNPWGHGGWTGKYSRNWKGWEPADKEIMYPDSDAASAASAAPGGAGSASSTVDAATEHRAGTRGRRTATVRAAKRKGDGTFIMSIGDFCKYFGVVELAVSREGWWHARRTAHLPYSQDATHWPAFRVEAASPGDSVRMTIAIQQPSDRLMHWWNNHIEGSPAVRFDDSKVVTEEEPHGLRFGAGSGASPSPASGATSGGAAAAAGRRIAAAAVASPGSSHAESRYRTPLHSGSPATRRSGGTRRTGGTRTRTRTGAGRGGSRLTSGGLSSAGGALGGIADLYGAMDGADPGEAASAHTSSRGRGSRSSASRTPSHSSRASHRPAAPGHGYSASRSSRRTGASSGAGSSRPTDRTAGAHPSHASHPSAARTAGAAKPKPSALVKLNAMTDIGLALLELPYAVSDGTKGSAAEPESRGGYQTLLAHARRETHDSVLLQHEEPAREDKGVSTVILPLGFGQLTRAYFASDGEKSAHPHGAPFTVQCLSSSPVRLAPVQVPVSVVAGAMIQRCVLHGVRMVVPTGTGDSLSGVYQLTNDSMCVVALVNASERTTLKVAVGYYSGQNVWFSRGHRASTSGPSAGRARRGRAGAAARAAGGSAKGSGRPSTRAVAATEDTLEPGSCMLLQVASQDKQFGTSGFAFKDLGVSSVKIPKGCTASDHADTTESHHPSLAESGGLHAVLSTEWLLQ